MTDLTVGTDAAFTATVVQPNDETADGSLTLTCDPYDFTLTTTPEDGTGTVIGQTQQETCTFTDLVHSASAGPAAALPKDRTWLPPLSGRNSSQ